MAGWFSTVDLERPRGPRSENFTRLDTPGFGRGITGWGLDGREKREEKPLTREYIHLSINTWPAHGDELNGPHVLREMRREDTRGREVEAVETVTSWEETWGSDSDIFAGPGGSDGCGRFSARFGRSQRRW